MNKSSFIQHCFLERRDQNGNAMSVLDNNFLKVEIAKIQCDTLNGYASTLYLPNKWKHQDIHITPDDPSYIPYKGL